MTFTRCRGRTPCGSLRVLHSTHVAIQAHDCLPRKTTGRTPAFGQKRTLDNCNSSPFSRVDWTAKVPFADVDAIVAKDGVGDGDVGWKRSFLTALELSRTEALLLASSCRRSTTTSSLITGLPSGRHHDKTGAWEMHTDISDRGIAASDDDLMDTRGDQLADDRVASGVIRRDGHFLTRFPAVGILRIGDYAGDGRSLPRRIERFFRRRWGPPAVPDCGNALGPTQQPRKTVERYRRWPETCFQGPNRVVGGEIS